VVPFFKLFLEPNNHFFIQSKYTHHYALTFYNKSYKLILLFFVFTLQDSIKFSGNGQKKCPKMDIPKYFAQKDELCDHN
jgi:hypothetical protein